MKRILVWDLPVRFFHWMLAVSFFAAFIIANTVDDHSPVFAVHMLLGGIMAFMLLLRVIWGFIGTKWARFGSFAASPKALFAYVKGAFTGREVRYTGHNPGSSIAAIVMFVCIVGLAVTGLLMERAHIFEEIHELLAWLWLITVGVHLLGIIFYTIRNRENVALSMIDGRKKAEPSEAIQTVRPAYGIVFLVLTGLWTVGLITGYDSETGKVTIPLTGQSVQVGEVHEGPHGEHH